MGEFSNNGFKPFIRELIVSFIGDEGLGQSHNAIPFSVLMIYTYIYIYATIDLSFSYIPILM